MGVTEAVPINGADAFARGLAEMRARIADLERRAQRSQMTNVRRSVSLVTPVTLAVGGAIYNTTSAILSIPLDCKRGDIIHLDSAVRIAADVGASGFVRQILMVTDPLTVSTDVEGFDCVPNNDPSFASDITVAYPWGPYIAAMTGAHTFTLKCATALSAGTFTINTNTTKLRADLTAG